MIYLIDDKKLRQNNDFGWSEDKLDLYNSVIYPIYTKVAFDEKRSEIFEGNNIVIYHESFLDKTHFANDAMLFRTEIERYANTNKEFKLIFFSGSKNSRSLEENIAHLSVANVYNNLKIFTEKYLEGDIKLEYLLYGDNPEIERVLSQKLDHALSIFDNEAVLQSSSETLYVRPKTKFIQNPIKGADDKMVFNDVSDERLSKYVIEWLGEKSYDKIFIPLCFGPTLSDFNGLRFALHIRTTQTPNQNKNIFLYSFVDHKYIIDNEYFDVLKTDNITLIEYTKEAFNKSVQSENKNFDLELIHQKLKVINLDPPKSYYDNHSIANEWAINRWAKLTDSNNKGISIITEKLNSDIYFKLLSTIYPIFDDDKLSDKDLKFKQNNKELKILLIDDEAEKGWLDVLCRIFSDINGMDELDYLGAELKLKTQDEIIEICACKVKDNDIDLVILDFRITENDHNELNVYNITGYKILEKIKQINPGIQVIVFSATNKVWNLLALQNVGADGFIVKESPEYSLDQTFTAEVIKNFCKTIDDAIERKFLKNLYAMLNQIENNIKKVDLIDENKKFNNFISELKTQGKVIKSGLDGIDLRRSTTLDIVFLASYNFLELFKKYYIVEQKDHRYYIGFDTIELKRYTLVSNSLVDKGIFIQNDINDKPSWFHSISGVFIDYFNIDKNNNIILYLWQAKELRNNYIHGKKAKFEAQEIEMIMKTLLTSTSLIKE